MRLRQLCCTTGGRNLCQSSKMDAMNAGGSEGNLVCDPSGQDNDNEFHQCTDNR